MSTLQSLGVRQPVALESPAKARPRRWLPPFAPEPFLVFSVCAAAYIAIGIRVTVGLHVVYADAESRLAHAYLVWWNVPGKLAAIGFVWPPLQTLALLPFALIRPLASSLVALPVFSGLCAAGLITVLNTTLETIGIARGWRYALLLAFAANPLLIDYAANGMAEILTMLLLALGVRGFVRWHLSDRQDAMSLTRSGIWMGLTFMSRYETLAWLLFMALSILAVGLRRRDRYVRLEGDLILFLAPVFYMSVIWAGLSSAIVGGSPLAWLTRAGGQGVGNDQGAPIAQPTAAKIAGDVLNVTGRISPLLLIVPVCLIAVACLRRRWFPAFVAGLVLIAPLVTFLLTLHSPDVGLLQFRYNMRSLPVVVLGAGLLIVAVPPGRWRGLVALIMIAGELASIPVAAHAMWNYPYQYAERQFIHALTTDRQARPAPPSQSRQENDAALAAWITAHIAAPKSILIDDGAEPAVMLLADQPDLFVNRTDHGDRAWLRVLRHPWGRVRYVIISFAPSGSSSYLSANTEPAAFAGRMPDTTVAYRNPSSVVLRLTGGQPAAWGRAIGAVGQ